MEPSGSSLEHQVPRGGPIYLPDQLSPLTNVPQFEALVLKELHNLTTELLTVDLSQISLDDLSVDELKILSEEELVDKALKEAFQVDQPLENQSQTPQQTTTDIVVRQDQQLENQSQTPQETTTNIVVRQDQQLENQSQTPQEMTEDIVVRQDKQLENQSQGDNFDKLETTKGKGKRKKRGRTFDRETRAAELNRINIGKIEELAKIKEKQELEKAAVKLHSFNGSGLKTNETLNPSPSPIEKMKSLRFSGMRVKASPNVQKQLPVSDSEILLCVEIYHNSKHWAKIQEFFVLGRQFLTELRDRIYCLTDQLMEKAKQHDPSGYFLIEDVFYNDMRDPSAIDYSKPIFDWISNSKDEALQKWEWVLSGELLQKQRALLGNERTPGLPKFKAMEMQKTRFCDLRFRLGGSNLYCHQGDCKHMFVIRDMRLIHPEDIQNRAAYPVLTFQMRTRRNKCSVCNLFQATKVTVDDKWAEKNPCYFCDNCYYLLHYNEDGSLLYNEFTVYDYHHDASVLAGSM